MSPALQAVDPQRYTTLRRMVEDPDHRLVVSLGGGGAPGIAGNLALAHLLEQLDLRSHVDEIWGTSAGAAVAGTWGSGASALEILSAAHKLRDEGAVDVAWGKLAAALLLRPTGRRLPDGIVHGRRFQDAIDRVLRARRIEECGIPVRLLAVRDDGTMTRKVFREGDLKRCIAASMAVPGVLIPTPVDDDSAETYYDGGLLEKTPLISPIAEHTRRGDGRRLLLIGTHFDNELRKVSARGFVARFLQALYALQGVAWEYQLNEARQRDDVTLLLLNPRLTEGALFDFTRLDTNFADSFGRFADILQNAKLPLALGTK